jgi:1-acyl-sn-glycerol-3-phosphate acyltransferase
MMPEGTRSETGEIGAAKRGIGLIIDKTGVPVVPCYIDGTHQAMRKKSKMIRPAKVRVLIGGPVAFGGGSPGEPNDQRQMRIAEKVLESIAQLKAEMESGL